MIPAAMPLVLLLWSFLLPMAAGVEVSSADLSRLQTDKNLGLAALEEGDLAEAGRRFEAVRRLAPGEPLEIGRAHV